jgi:uncharacterized protein (TIGR02118 family)
MIKVSVLYPNGDDARFDMAYYLDSHMPMVRDKLGPILKGSSVDQGLAGGAPGVKPMFVAAAHLLFETVADFESSFGPHTGEIMSDVPNYTNIEPVVLISEIKY